MTSLVFNALSVGRKTWWFLLVGSFLTPIVFFIYTTVLEPRPYYILETDIENDYCYAARLLHAGQPLFAFMYITATVSFSSVDSGVTLRNVAPSALFIPFLILYCHRLSYARGILARINTTESQVWLVSECAGRSICGWYPS